MKVFFARKFSVETSYCSDISFHKNAPKYTKVTHYYTDLMTTFVKYSPPFSKFNANMKLIFLRSKFVEADKLTSLKFDKFTSKNEIRKFDSKERKF